MDREHIKKQQFYDTLSTALGPELFKDLGRYRTGGKEIPWYEVFCEVRAKGGLQKMSCEMWTQLRVKYLGGVGSDRFKVSLKLKFAKSVAF